MAKLYYQGNSLEDIAAMLGGSRETIRYHLRKSGTTLRDRGMQTKQARFKYSGAKHHGWKGGRSRDHGYVRVLLPEHPHANGDGYILEHRLVMERHLLATDPTHKAIKRKRLRRDWIVHHRNGNKSDNRIENLEPLRRGEHSSWLHYHDEMAALRRENERLKELLRAPTSSSSS